MVVKSNNCDGLQGALDGGLDIPHSDKRFAGFDKEKNDRPNTGRANWKKRWSCCAEYDENAPPCRRGWHVCYDDGFTLY